MSIPPFPPPPSSADPANFDARADAFLGSFPAFQVAANQLADDLNARADDVDAAAAEVEERALEVSAAAMSAANAAGLVGRSISQLVVGPGTKNITLLAAKPELVVLNRRVVLAQLSDPSIKMFGTISSVTSSSVFAVTVVSSGVFGSGSYSSWSIIDAAFFGSAATKEELWAGTSDASATSPKTFRDARIWVPLTDAATVTPDGRNGRNFTWTIAGNRLLGAITNTAPNDTFLLEITQDATGGRDIAWAAGVYYRAGGLPALSDAPNAKDYLQLRVINVDANGTATRVLAQFVRGPTN